MGSYIRACILNNYNLVIAANGNEMIMGIENGIKHIISTKAECNKFSKNVVFTGIQFTSDCYQVSSIRYLNELLEREWNRVNINIIAKYGLIKNIIGQDISLVIMELICLLGYYS